MSDSPTSPRGTSTATTSTPQGGVPGQDHTRPGTQLATNPPHVKQGSDPDWRGRRESTPDYWGKVFGGEIDAGLPVSVFGDRNDQRSPRSPGHASFGEPSSSDALQDEAHSAEGGTTTEEGEKPEKGTSEDPKLSSKFAMLAKQERQLREQRKAFAEEKAKVEQWAAQQALLAKDPYAYAKSVGLTLDKLIPLALAGDNTEESDPLMAKVSELEAKLNARDAAEKEAAQKAERAADEAAAAESLGYVAEIVSKNPERFELVIAHGAEPDVFRLILTHWNEQGGDPATRTVMSIEEAAGHIEDSLLEEAQRFTKAKKVRALVSPQEERSDSLLSDGFHETAKEERAPAEREWAGHSEVQARPVTRFERENTESSLPLSPTLTNSKTAASAAGAPSAARPMTREQEIKAAAIKLFGRP